MGLGLGLDLEGYSETETKSLSMAAERGIVACLDAANSIGIDSSA